MKCVIFFLIGAAECFVSWSPRYYLLPSSDLFSKRLESNEWGLGPANNSYFNPRLNIQKIEETCVWAAALKDLKGNESLSLYLETQIVILKNFNDTILKQ